MIQSIDRSAKTVLPSLFNLRCDDGTRLFYKDWGTGKPVIFIHGWALNADIWEYQMTELVNRNLRCIAYDRRGCGRSSQPGGGYDFDRLADDLAALIEQLDLHKVTLIAHSMGGGEIARYLSRHGDDRIDRVVFVAATTPFLLKTADNPDGIDKSFYDNMIAEVNKDRPHYLATVAPTFFGVDLLNSVSSEMMQWAVGLALQASPKASIDMIRALSETDFRADLRNVTVPTLILHGDRDKYVPIEVSGYKTAQLIPSSQLKLYEGAAHGLFITHKDRFNLDLLTFIQG
ncbi:alpha/beta hydrolase [Gloeocapsopsis sp. IPPAS B-1203]|uniref:alpha/beta fold hydrolase n=1 Tax=Gloeocapsopsis sp. IPPAS B-1203 TaxID=2049454 RepID=UPI000C1A722A|nr:alpha/beta hydrolase [Gloeocapsopsis sp. IPPAS B-1203]PIG91211.1 alpha/beta hydrolase [Gloeocapsopsis sp. IPPAS B-1203]